MKIRSPHPARKELFSDSGERGAALIIALSVLLVLLSLAITFSLIVRYESQMSQQAFHRARAERLLDGALAQAQYRLNRDLEVYPDALSLDHGWRSWFSGAAFVGKDWARQFQGVKAGVPLTWDSKGLMCISIEPVERALRAEGLLSGGVLYARFLKDGYREPLFRGPRTEHWLYVPRQQSNLILLFADEAEVNLVNFAGVPLAVNAINTALSNQGRPEQIAFFNEKNLVADPNAFPFVTPAFFNQDPAAPARLPDEQVNIWADVDSNSDGMRDAMWMPIARDLNHFGDGIDNMLGGWPDPVKNGVPLLETAPFVYHGWGRPEAVRTEDPVGLETISRLPWDVRLVTAVDTDGFDNAGTGIKDDPTQNRLFLTVPLPGLVTQVDLNSDGVFDDRDRYESTVGTGPVFVKVPDQIFVPVITGADPSGNVIVDRVPLTIASVDVLDNDNDLIANNFRSYAYVAPHAPDTSWLGVYDQYVIPYSEDAAAAAHYTQWRPYADPVDDANAWLADDKQSEIFAGAHNRGYHDINVDVVLGGPANTDLDLFITANDGTALSLPAADPLYRILRRPNALHITCSGESVTEITGRYAVQISDEASKVNLNTSGGHIYDENDTLVRSLHLGMTPFEYENRMLPNMGTTFSEDFWGMRTGALQPRFNGVDQLVPDEYLNDALLPGYGRVDDNGNALLLSLSGKDESGSGLEDDGLFLPNISSLSMRYQAGLLANPTFENMRLINYENQIFRYTPRFNSLGRFEGIDEPMELRLYNPLANTYAEFDLGVPGAYSDKILLRKEELTRHGLVGDTRWNFLRNLVTVNSDTRNTFHVTEDDIVKAFLQIDPNTATHQQLAATLMIKADVDNIVDYMAIPNITASRFHEGLRQFDTAFTGDFMGAVRTSTNAGGRFPADPVLQVMRLAADIAAARTQRLGIKKLSTENIVRNPDVYAEYLSRAGGVNNILNPPPEPLNERERIPADELMAMGDVQEYLEDSLGILPEEKRLISPDLWWKGQTNEDRLFEYKTASTDAIRINEIMVRPVRRVEAETMPLAVQGSYPEGIDNYPPGYNVNLDPAPYPGMLSFDMDIEIPLAAPKWVLRSAYNDDTNSIQQPILGEKTAFVYEPTSTPLPEDIIEFKFRPSAGLPAGRYYLTVNLSDQYGRMTANSTDIIQYSIKYSRPGNASISEDIRLLLRRISSYQGINDILAQEYGDIFRSLSSLFQSVDSYSFIASQSAKESGSAMSAGWAFMPVRSRQDSSPQIIAWENNFQQFRIELSQYLFDRYGYGNPDSTPFDLSTTSWDDLSINIIIPWFFNNFLPTFGLSCATPPTTQPTSWLELVMMINDPNVNCPLPSPDPNVDPDYAAAYDWILLFSLLDNLYGSNTSYFSEASSYSPVTNTSQSYTVIVPELSNGELCIALRMNPSLNPRPEFVQQVDNYLNGLSGYLPQPGTYADEQHMQNLISSGSLILPSGYVVNAPTLAINFFDFSQEPSHEYLELANTSDEEVDVSGWFLEVGIPDPPGSDYDEYMKDPFKSQWRIPDGVKVAAQGHLLLGFDGREECASPLLSTNGMGLISDGNDGITVPPIADRSKSAAYGVLSDSTGSVFLRENGLDYIDNDGDGLSSQFFALSDQTVQKEGIAQALMDAQKLPVKPFPDIPEKEYDGLDNAIYKVLDTDHVLAEFQTHGTSDGGTPEILAGSRIVQLENVQLWKENLSLPPNPAALPNEKYLFRLNPYNREQGVVDLANISDIGRLAQLVLRGGIFPNYPERDGIDNDGDGGYITSNQTEGYARFQDSIDETIFYDEALLSYVPGPLDKDMIDNNCDSYIDNRGYQLRQVYTIPSVFPGISYNRHGNPLLSEGVDEGMAGIPVYYGLTTPMLSNYVAFLPKNATGLPRFYGAGSYESLPLPLYSIYGNAAVIYRENWIPLVTNSLNLFNAGLVPEEGFPWSALLSTIEYSDVVNTDIAPVLQTTDSPDWQAMVERRWNPGDNVIVTLYAGHPSKGIVADQVTYNELDVINRTVDDIELSPYGIHGYADYSSDGESIVWNGSGDISLNPTRVCLDPTDPGRSSFWLPDHMGLDFYRSLERKHPLYHGDRYGTANRWTATDGAYDDWADSISVFQTGLGVVTGAGSLAFPGRQAYRPNASSSTPPVDDSIIQRRDSDVFGPEYAEHKLQLYGHAFWGSPLRMNTQARHWENPWDLAQLALNLKPWLQTNPSASDTHYRNQRYGHQFPGLEVYRNTGHDLRLGAQPALDLERRLASDGALRRALLRKKPFSSLGDLLELPQLSFEKILEGPTQYVDDGSILYRPQYAVTPVNTRYFSKEVNLLINFSENVDLFAYGVDRDLTSALFGQSVYGGGASVYPQGLRSTAQEPRSMAKDVLDVSSMNPVMLTVGQALVTPLWPAPDSPDPEQSQAGGTLSQTQLAELFRWQGSDPSYMWTPVYLFDLPYNQAGTIVNETPWMEARYPRRVGLNAVSFPPLTSTDGDPLASPAYLFNGRFIGNRLYPALAGETDDNANTFLANTLWPRWPVRNVASVIASDFDVQSASDRAVMYISRYQPAYGEINRPEAMFVWDKTTGLENGTYIAYIGTFIPGMREKIERAAKAVAREGLDEPLLYDGPFSAITNTVLELDPSHPAMAGNSEARRFDTRLSFEFITDRRYAEQMLQPGADPVAIPGMRHPTEWRVEQDTAARGEVYAAGPDGYIFYSDDPQVAWRPVPVRVTDNYLALRVRNMGDYDQVACITHVILAPAPRTRGTVNINTTETQRYVRGMTGENWWVGLFNALSGLPGVVNALNPEADISQPPYDSDALGLPEAQIPKATFPDLDPWRERWRTPPEEDLLTALGSLPPALNEGDTPLVGPTDPNPSNWNADRHGRASLRLTSMIAAGRTSHPEGRFYESASDLLSGIYGGGIALRDNFSGPWPLSNLGLEDGFEVLDDRSEIGLRYRNQMERRHEEIIQRFSQMSSMITTRSDVFEIIATVQAGSMADTNGDGVMDYRGDEFYPQAETRARVIYDRRARTVRMDESRE